MKNFFLEILKKLISTILFAVLMFVASYCFVTGEFPPKFENMKKGIHGIQAQVQQLNKIRESQMAKLAEAANQADAALASAHATDEAEIKYQQALLDKIKELEARIAKLEKQNH